MDSSTFPALSKKVAHTAGGLVLSALATQQQDWLFERLRDTKADVQVFLVNGIRLNGRIESFDRYTIHLSRGSSSQVVYKHAISTVVPPEGFQIDSPDL